MPVQGEPRVRQEKALERSTDIAVEATREVESNEVKDDGCEGQHPCREINGE